jgi:photosystem II stability/assembly factor-like uncharacterized protein
MKKIYHSLIFLSALSIFNILFSQTYWIRQPSPTTKWLYKCSFSDSLHGWAAGDSGIIINTSNAGNNWSIQNSSISSFIYDISFVNKNIGWGIANDYSYIESIILKTTNGGNTWTHYLYPDSSIFLTTVCFTDSLNGFLGGYQGVILQTTNGGINWSRPSIDSGFYYHFHINKIKFYNNLLGFAAGGVFDLGGVIWRTSDGGFNWHAYSVAPEPEFNILVKSPGLAYGCGGDYEYGTNFIKSTDGGILWEYKPLNIFGIGEAVCFRTPADVWIPLGFSQRWAHSVDSSNTWREVMGTDSTAVYDAVFLDSLHGWAFGVQGSIFKYNVNAIGIKPISTNIPTENKLLQNFPNPFNPGTTIEYKISGKTRVRIIVYDILGKEVSVIVDALQEPGEYSISFDAHELSSGVYFYKLIANSFTQTMKMVVAK